MITTDLSSRVEETLAACPRLTAVQTGVGKSSLVSSVFNISLKDIDIAHDRAGTADISFAYRSDENPRFILHDTQGFKPGSTGSWYIVERFLRKRSETRNVGLEDRVHAIW
ncbi:hypothetical protein M422DRAFT_174777 [Sphaerobolus stellatus SS14]|uniref:G domain-containing protein n=1 Tax=Sphaerobolus stellatus (strain SS14) TaxID=990650 RepID=A0A0C9U9F9_SPHS4|nr:hypothetical protein M422DRAFT_174777 [Sphaerobolus stellatus SS14]